MPTGAEGRLVHTDGRHTNPGNVHEQRWTKEDYDGCLTYSKKASTWASTNAAKDGKFVPITICPQLLPLVSCSIHR